MSLRPTRWEAIGGGERVGNSIVVIGALGALVLAWLEVDHLRIASKISVVVSGLPGRMARLGLYRRAV